MKKRTILSRSGPVYVETQSRTITLIEEVSLSEHKIAGIRLSRLRPNALFVIDDQGVHRLPFAAMNMPALVLTLLAVLCAPLQYWLLVRRPMYER